MINLILAALCSADGYVCWFMLPEKFKVWYYIIVTYLIYIAFISFLVSAFGWLLATLLIFMLLISFFSYCLLTAEEMEE